MSCLDCRTRTDIQATSNIGTQLLEERQGRSGYCIACERDELQHRCLDNVTILETKEEPKINTMRKRKSTLILCNIIYSDDI